MYSKSGFISFSVLLFFLPLLSVCYIILSVDLGSRFIKNGILRSGFQAEVVYDESGRKFSTAVSFRDEPPKIGEDAYRAITKYPSQTLIMFPEFLSKMYNNSETLNKISNVLSDSSHDLNECIAMLIKKSVGRTISFAGQNVDACILAIPFYLNYRERLTLLTLASSVGLNVTSLVPSGFAAALNFGLFHVNEFEKNPIIIMIFDIGATSTRISLFELSHKRFEDQTNHVPSVTTLFNGARHNMGTVHFQSLIMQMMRTQFERKSSNTQLDARSLAKFFVHSERALERMSLMNVVDFSIENLIDGDEFDFSISKKEFEEHAAPLVKEIQAIVLETLAKANVSKENIKQVIPIGGGCRIAIVEDAVCQLLNRSSFDRRVNMDEAISLGSIYYAASFSQFFRTKSFVAKDLLTFSVKIVIPPTSSNHNQSIITLFSTGSLYPKRKAVTVRNRQDDFTIDVLIFDGEEIENNSINSTIRIFGVNEAYKSYPSDAQHLGIKISFEIDESQQILVKKVEYRVRIQQVTTTFQGLKDRLYRTFGLNNKENKTSPDVLNETVSEDTVNNSSTNNTGDARLNSSESVNSTKTVIKSVVLSYQFNISHNYDMQKEIERKLNKYEEQERRRVELEQLQNDLESWIFKWSSNLNDRKILIYAKSKEVEAIRNSLSEKRSWFDEYGFTADIEQLRTNYDQVKKLTIPIEYRITQHKQTENELRKLKSLYNTTKRFLRKSVNLTETVNLSAPIEEIQRTKPLLQSEYDFLKLKLNESMLWLEDMEQKQNKLSLSDDPVLTATDIENQSVHITRELNFLKRRIKYFVYARPLNVTLPNKFVNETKNDTVVEIGSDDFKGVSGLNETILDGNQTIVLNNRDEL